MVKQITDLTLKDFPNVYTLNDHIRLATNISNLNPVVLGNRRTGYRIRMFSNIGEIPKFKTIYVAAQIDIYADDIYHCHMSDLNNNDLTQQFTKSVIDVAESLINDGVSTPKQDLAIPDVPASKRWTG